ncbi:translation initiation factor IF-2 N-terminal domain-containing protein [Corynebacterium durum]
MAQTIEEFDRSTLGPKTRVHALAKQLGMTSKELIVALDGLGLVKVAQSNLSLDEANKLLDALQPAEPSEPAVEEKPKKKGKKKAKKQPEDKIRKRVEKNVANEIHQIEEKVDRELSELLDEDEGIDAEALAILIPEVSEPAEEPVTQVPPFATPVFLAPEAVEEDLEVETSVSDEDEENSGDAEDTSEDGDGAPSKRKRRGRRGKGRGRGAEAEQTEDEDVPEGPVGIKGSTRLEAQRRRRTERREEERKKRHVVSEAEFLARRESVDRTMVVRERQRNDHPGLVTQVGVLEDDLLVEHFVTSESQSSLVGNIYLGRVQNVLPSMEAAFIDIGKGRNGVLYAGEVDWRARGLGGRGRKIEQALKSGDQVLVQVTKDPVGHKGARLTTQISLAGRYLVYVPSGRATGISRKLPENERKRLKNIVKDVVPDKGGAIIRTAAEGVDEAEIAADVRRLHNAWEQIQQRTDEEKNSKGAKPVTMYEEPDMLVKVVRDLFNEDFTHLVVEGKRAWNTVHAYVQSVAPDLLDRLVRYNPDDHDGEDAFTHYRIDEQLEKAMSRKVWLPSGGTLVIDRTEAMTVIDVNTGKFTGAGGDLEETITSNNLEAAEEIVRQIRLRDLGGMIVIDFIDMVLPANQELVLRRLTEALGRDRTRHQVSEVTSLGLVQMTRKKLGSGLLETFATECQECEGRGIIVHSDPVEQRETNGNGRKRKKAAQHPVVVAMHDAEDEIIDAEVVEESTDAEVAGEAARSIEELAAAVVVDEKPAQTYEQALEEYETSPRRKRATRGNSRSDVPPRPEDFVEPEPAPEPERPEKSKKEDKPRRGRRRAVKRNAEKVAEVVEGDVEVGTTASRRHRRRAVRRMSSAAQQPNNQEKTQGDAGVRASESSTRGRGRRRAVRKRATN